MKIRLAKKITKVGDIPPMNMKLSMRKSYWFRKWEEAINNNRCMCICDEWYNCKFHRREDAEHLRWLYNRMVSEHGESVNFDYMHRFAKIFNKLKQL